MRVVNYAEFSKNLAENLNSVNNDKDIIIVSGSEGKDVVVMSLEEYNAIQETLHLMSTTTNRNRIDAAINEMNEGSWEKHDLIDP